MKYILLLATSLVFVGVPAFAQQGGLPALQAQVNALQAQNASLQQQITSLQTSLGGLQTRINALTSCSVASLVGTYILKSFDGFEGPGILAVKGTLVADGQGNLTFQGVETQISIDNPQAGHEVVTTTPQPLIYATYVVNADCTMVVTTAEGKSKPFGLLPGGAIAVETSDNSSNKMGIGLAIRQ